MEKHNKLDVAAKMFPSVSGKNNSSVFRVSVILTEEVDPHTLQLAVNIIYERYALFFYRLRRGVFWNYFDTNHIHFNIEKESNSPCDTIISHENKGYIIKVLYHANRISVEAFHAVTDGSGVAEFIKSLVYYYICIKHEQIDAEGKVLLFDQTEKNDDDSFTEHFVHLENPKRNVQKRPPNAFKIKGDRYKKRGNCVVVGTLSISALKAQCKQRGCTITAYLIATMIMSIYEQNQRHTFDKKPIVVSVPVNLRKIFTSRTLRNFFGVVSVDYAVTADTTFDDVLSSATEQLKSAVDQQNLQALSVNNVKMSKNILSTYTPLAFKNIVMPLGYHYIGEVKRSLTISNIGKLDFPSGLVPYIVHTEVLLYPTAKSPMNCGVCSFEDKLAISFTRSIKDSAIVRGYFSLLADLLCTEIAVYSNNWGEEYEKV